MNTLGVIVATSLIAACFQLASAGVGTLDKYLWINVEKTYGIDVDHGVAAVKELLNKKYGLGVLPSHTAYLCTELLMAHKMVREKNCSPKSYERKYHKDLFSGGASERLLDAILDRHDKVCILEVIEKERPIYESLDETLRAQLESYSTRKTVNDQLAYLEEQSHEQRCQFLGREAELLSKYLFRPCAEYANKMEVIEVMQEFAKIPAERFVKSTNSTTYHRDDLSKSFHQEQEEFFKHVEAYETCSVIITPEEKSSTVEKLNHELKIQCAQ